MTGNGRHTAGIFSQFSPRHSRFIPGYENSRLDQKKLGRPYIIPGQMRNTYVLNQFLDQESFPVLSLIVHSHSQDLLVSLTLILCGSCRSVIEPCSACVCVLCLLFLRSDSRCTSQRLKNLQKHVTTPKKAYVKNITDKGDADYNHTKQHETANLLEEGFFFFDKDSDSDEDSEYEEKDIDEEELAK